ncbi:MAG: hypothetical protein LAT64_04945 [Phycisphaerales bacterium]|nr:hypothetical protein [Planctomycetota bacterium]MCH8508102.1 hypothetical protein [Phycisphaerales bacterium]
MKKSILTAALALCAGSAMTQASVLLIVDNTDASNVVVFATGNAATIDLGGGSPTIISGITLMGLFDGAGLPLPIGNIIGGNLSPNGNPGAYNRAGNQFGTLTSNDLNFWGSAVGGGQNFNTTDAAFSGATSGMNFAGAGFNLSGDIRAGDTPTGAVIGTWQLIPSPSTTALLGLAGFVAARRRR